MTIDPGIANLLLAVVTVIVGPIILYKLKALTDDRAIAAAERKALAEKVSAVVVAVADTKAIALKTEINTNSMKDALMKATGEAAHSAGKEEERAAGEAKAAAIAEGAKIAMGMQSADPRNGRYAEGEAPLPVKDERTAVASERVAVATERVADAAEEPKA